MSWKIFATVLLGVCLCCPYFSNGQPTISAAAFEKPMRFSVGVNVSPDYTYRRLTNNDGSSSSDVIIGLRDKLETAKAGYTIGICALLRKSARLGFEIGLQYSNKGYAFGKTDLVFSPVIDPRYNLPYSTGPIYTVVNYNYHYLDIPVRVIYNLGGRKIKFIASVGVATNVLVNAPPTAIFEGDTSGTGAQAGQGYEFRKLNLSPHVALGFNYRVSENVDLCVEPTFRYGLLKIIDAPITGYLWNAGLIITGYYTFR